MATVTVQSASFSDVAKGATLALTAQDGNGVAVPFTSDAPPIWDCSDKTLFSLTPAADGKSCTVVPVAGSGKVGSANVTASFTVGGQFQQVIFPIADTPSGETTFGGTVTPL